MAQPISMQPPKVGAQPLNPDFIRNRARRVVENRQESNCIFLGKSQFKEGYEVSRLMHPPVDQINEDFLCAIC